MEEVEIRGGTTRKEEDGQGRSGRKRGRGRKRSKRSKRKEFR